MNCRDILTYFEIFQSQFSTDYNASPPADAMWKNWITIRWAIKTWILQTCAWHTITVQNMEPSLQPFKWTELCHCILSYNTKYFRFIDQEVNPALLKELGIWQWGLRSMECWLLEYCSYRAQSCKMLCTIGKKLWDKVRFSLASTGVEEGCPGCHIVIFLWTLVVTYSKSLPAIVSKYYLTLYLFP